MYQFSIANITQNHKQNGVEQQTLLSHSLEARSLKFSCEQGYAPSETCRGKDPSLCFPAVVRYSLACGRLTSLHMAFSLCLSAQSSLLACLSLLFQSSTLYQDTSPIGSGSTLMNDLILTSLSVKTLFLNKVVF